ncbi:MAG: hypothetical protein IPN70_04850 [Candidatus Moraniibacteriota bacterium]|nr:MAG: hypothetical protein IPN70_04850 [Candidatus Moranbacteria bacterium]
MNEDEPVLKKAGFFVFFRIITHQLAFTSLPSSERRNKVTPWRSRISPPEKKRELFS